MVELGVALRERRKALGLSQAVLSAGARVSLATVQNLEAGRANPSLRTLERLLGPLGLRLDLVRAKAHWEELSFLGLPLSVESPRQVPATAEALRGRLALAAAELAEPGGGDARSREREALQALLLALATHFPSRYRAWVPKSPLLAALVPVEPTGRMVKLARLARRRLAEYL